MATAPAGQSRNPFLSPQPTGASSIHPPPIAVNGPALHTAFQSLSLAPPQQPLSPPQPTAASTSSNNPFLDRPPQPHQSPPGRPLSAQDLSELEGTAVRAVERETAPSPQQQQQSTPARDEKARPPQALPISSAQPVASSSYASTSGRRVAEGNEDFRDDDEALEAAIQASLAETTAQPEFSSAARAASSPLLPSHSSPTAFAPPARPPPLPSSARPTSPVPSQAPADPPPAYTPSTQVQESTLDAGPRVPEFARRPELEPQMTGWSDGGGNPGGFLEPGDPGYRPLGPPPGRQQGPSSPSLHSSFNQHPPPPPQQHFPPPPQHPQQRPSYSSGASPSHRPPQHQPLDPTPSQVPIVGRPFLNNGQALVYPNGTVCYKCNNSGWKENDPTHPCRTCWKRYGRPYSTALALSWQHPIPPGYQRPLGPPLRPTFPAQHSSWATPQGMYRPVVNAPPPGSVVYQPGDPRIGGALCMKCHGAGVTIGFFEDDTCSRCGGVGRVF